MMSSEAPELAVLREDGPEIIGAFETQLQSTIELAEQLWINGFVAKATYNNVMTTVGNVGAAGHLHTMVQAVRSQISMERTEAEKEKRFKDFLNILAEKLSKQKLAQQLKQDYGRLCYKSDCSILTAKLSIIQ